MKSYFGILLACAGVAAVPGGTTLRVFGNVFENGIRFATSELAYDDYVGIFSGIVNSHFDVPRFGEGSALVERPAEKAENGHGGLERIAFDGFGIYGVDSEIPKDLDACGGHIGLIPSNDVYQPGAKEIPVYHYHGVPSSCS